MLKRFFPERYSVASQTSLIKIFMKKNVKLGAEYTRLCILNCRAITLK